MKSLICVTLALIAVLLASVAADSSICSNAPYKDFLFLENYSIAKAYCMAVYPVEPVTVHEKRGATTTSAVVSSTTSSTKKTTTLTTMATTTKSSIKATTTSSSASNTCQDDCSAWKECQKKGAQFVKTLCSCIQQPKTITVSILL